MKKNEDKKQELFEKIWNECKDDLTHLCNFKMQSCSDEIEDVIADAFFNLWKAIYSDMRITNHKAWLYGVTEKLIIKKYTETKRLKNQFFSSIDIEDELTCFLDEEVFIDSLISDSTIDNIRRQVIDKLSDSERELYDCIYGQKLKSKAIAANMNSTETAIKQKRYRLNKKLKLLIKNQLEEMWTAC